MGILDKLKETDEDSLEETLGNAIKEASQLLGELSKGNEETDAQEGIDLGQLGGLFNAFVSNLQDLSAGIDTGSKTDDETAEEEHQTQTSSSWNEILRPIPEWTAGDNIELNIEEGYCCLTAEFNDHDEAIKAVEAYRDQLVSAGFTPKYDDLEHLCKIVNGKTYEADTEHCFESDDSCPTIYFLIS